MDNKTLENLKAANPFSAGPMKNYTMQVLLLRDDPSVASELMDDAGYTQDEIRSLLKRTGEQYVDEHNRNHGKFFHI